MDIPPKWAFPAVDQATNQESEALIYWKTYFRFTYYFGITPFHFKWDEKTLIWTTVKHPVQRVLEPLVHLQINRSPNSSNPLGKVTMKSKPFLFSISSSSASPYRPATFGTTCVSRSRTLSYSMAILQLPSPSFHSCSSSPSASIYSFPSYSAGRWRVPFSPSFKQYKGNPHRQKEYGHE